MMGTVVGVNMRIGATPRYDGALALIRQKLITVKP